jgi:hypothetical protein
LLATGLVAIQFASKARSYKMHVARMAASYIRLAASFFSN